MDLPTEAVTQRRKFKRFPLRTPVIFSWPDSQGVGQSGEGTSRDISIGGVFVVSETTPREGATVAVEVMLFAARSAVPKFRVPGKGRVARVERGGRKGQMSGFAVQAEFAFPTWNAEGSRAKRRMVDEIAGSEAWQGRAGSE